MKRGLKGLMTKLTKTFPELWLKDGAEFHSGYGHTLWTGEGSYMPYGLPAFDHYNYEFYEMGIHPKLFKFLAKGGWYCEFHDAGTVFIGKGY